MVSVATLTGLRSLDIGGCPMISEPGAATVAAALTDLRELRYPACILPWNSIRRYASLSLNETLTMGLPTAGSAARRA